MKCNCSDWDDESPCPRHTPKLPQPAVVEHSIIVVKVYRMHRNKKWYYVIVRDGVTEFCSQYFDTKKEATPI